MSTFNPHSAATGQITKIMEYAESETYRIENLERALVRAAAAGKIETVKYLVELGCRINIPDAYGNTPFHAAADGNQITVLKYLIKIRGEFIEELIAAIENYDTMEEDLGSLIMSDEKREQMKIISELRKKIFISGNAKDHLPIFLAGQNGHVDVVKLLLKEESKNKETGVRDTEMHMNLSILMRTAAVSGDESMMSILLKPKHEINPNDVEKGKTVLSLAVQHGHDGVIRMLLRDDRVDKEFASRSNRGWTPVHIAAAHGRLGALKCLLASGCNSSPLNTKGETPLLLAVKEFLSWKNPSTRDRYREYHKVIEFLIEIGCDSEVRDKKNDNVVSYVLLEVEKTQGAAGTVAVGKIILTLVFNKGYNLSGLTSTNQEIQGLINKYFYPKFSSFLMARVPRYNHLMREFPRETLERIHGFGTGKL